MKLTVERKRSAEKSFMIVARFQEGFIHPVTLDFKTPALTDPPATGRDNLFAPMHETSYVRYNG